MVRDNIFDAFYKLTDSNSQIRSYVFDVVRATVPKMDLDDVFSVSADVPVECNNGAGTENVQTCIR